MSNMGNKVQTIEVELADGTFILAEVAVAGSGGDASAFRRLALPNLRADISRITRLVHDSVVGALPEAPRRFGVEFGVKFAVESAGLATVLAKASGEATIVVHLEWENPSPE